jgi:putative hydrolase of the HAD superfamily
MSFVENFKAVTFDVGGTLMEPFPSVGHVYAEVAARHGLQIAPDLLNARFAAAWKAKKFFGHSLRDWSDLVDATFAGLAEPMPSKSFFSDLYAAFTRPEAWHIFDDVVPTLEHLQARGIRLAVISNWDERLRPLLQALNLAPYFEATFVSLEVGIPKPEKKIFQTAANYLQLPPSAILHVGDSFNEDVTGARNAGFNAVLIARGKAPITGEQLSSLTEI